MAKKQKNAFEKSLVRATFDPDYVNVDNSEENTLHL